jgi:AcrR family transcriptional regulator
VTTRPTPGPRERLIRAAQELSYTHGAAVGVDAVLEAANVARRSLYDHFGGKDGLIAEMLRRSAAEDEARYVAVLAAGGDNPGDRLMAVFDELIRAVSSPEFRGCRYLTADLTLVDADHPGHAVTREYRRRLHRLLERELEQIPHPWPARAADQLLLLIEGTLATAATRPESRPAERARELARDVLDKSH